MQVAARVVRSRSRSFVPRIPCLAAERRHEGPVHDISGERRWGGGDRCDFARPMEGCHQVAQDSIGEGVANREFIKTPL